MNVLDKHLILGKDQDGKEVRLRLQGSRILLSGTSGCGKSTFSAAIIEELTRNNCQFCLIDPEGDYQTSAEAISIGNALQKPAILQIMEMLKQPTINVNVCLLGVPLSERPEYFRHFLTQITALRQQIGRPNFLILDEAHHILPKESSNAPYHLFDKIESFLAITTQSSLLHKDLVNVFNTRIIMRQSRNDEVLELTRHTSISGSVELNLDFGNALILESKSKKLRNFQTIMPRQSIKRHKRKYASGDMGYHSFYFTGPCHSLNIKAQNLMLFIQIAEGIDDGTWLYHLQRHDYSNWLRNSVKNAELADSIEVVENGNLDAGQSRSAIFSLIESEYTAPA